MEGHQARYARAPYSDKGTPDRRNANDNKIDPDLIVPLTAQGDGYSGSFHIGVNMAQRPPQKLA